MFKNLFYAICAMIFIVSCAKDDASYTVENYVTDSMISINENCMTSRAGCFEIVFPITIQFPDGTTAEVDSKETMRMTIREWREANADTREKPTVVFPIDVITEDGEVVTLSSREELRELVKECRGTFGGHGGGHGGGHPHGTEPCFTLNFPISLEFSDGTITAYDDWVSLKQGVRAWKENNPDNEVRPVFVFPISVTLEDETVQELNSIDELKALKEDCRG